MTPDEVSLVTYDKSCEDYLCDSIVEHKKTGEIIHCGFRYDYHWGGQAFMIFKPHLFVKCNNSSLKETIKQQNGIGVRQKITH